MSRINKAAALALMLSLCVLWGAANAQDLIAPDQIQADEVKYNTVDVTYGTFSRQVAVVGSEYYPLTTTVRYQGDAAVYVSAAVRRGDTVQAGDVLAYVTVDYDPVDMAQRELELERTQKAYDEALEACQQAIDELQEALSAERDSYNRQILILQLERAKIQKEQTICQYEYQIDTQQRQIDELNERHSHSEVLAPIDGVVSSMEYLKEGARIYNGQALMEIDSQDIMLIALKESKLRYGMSVTLETGPAKDRIITQGHVVAASDCLKNVVSDYALVAIDDDNWQNINWRNTRVTADYVYVDNVLLVSRNAVTLNGGKYIVTKLTPEGVTQKRFVNQALFTPQTAWIIQGLEDGEQLVLD